MTTENNPKEVPLELQTHHKDQNTIGQEVPLELQTHNDDIKKPRITSPMDYPEVKRLSDVAAGGAGALASTGLLVPSGIYKKGLDLLPLLKLDPTLLPGGLHRYLNSQIGNIGGEISAKDLAKATNMAKVQNFPEVQQAIALSKGLPPSMNPVYAQHPNGLYKDTGFRDYNPGTAPIDLSPYAVPKKVATGKPKLDLATNVVRSVPGRGFLGGYNAMDAINQDNPLQTGIAAVGTAGALAPYAEPLLPTKIRQKTLPKQLGGLAALGAPIINLILDQFKSDPDKDIGVLGKKAEGGAVHMAGGGKLGLLTEAAAPLGSKMLQELSALIKAEGRTPVVPASSEWFKGNKGPQPLIEKVLEKTGKERSDYPYGAFVDPRTGEVLDQKIYGSTGVLIDPNTRRPMMSVADEMEALNSKNGLLTKSNLLKDNKYRVLGGDSLLGNSPFIATIDSGPGHFYGMGTEYATPTMLKNLEKGTSNPYLRPYSHGDLFGMGDVIGQVKPHGGKISDVYEKLFVAPKGSDVPGVRLNRAEGGVVGYSGGRSVSNYKQEHTAQAYDPSYSEQIKDYAKKFLTKEQADAIFGGPTAGFLDKINPISMLAQTPGVIADSAKGFLESSKQGDYPSAMLNSTVGLLNVAPFVKPAAKVATATGKTVLKELGPKFGEMSEDFLHRVGALHPITAYHGTPHKIQGAFDLTKVGTGEGHQTFGHGIYFAQEPKVSEQYRKTLSEKLNKTTGSNVKGNLYKVDIPDEQIPKMLDLDKPLSEQKHVWDALHPDVRNAIDDLMERQYRNPMSEVPEAYMGRNLYRALSHHDVGEVLPAEVPNSSWLKGDTSYEKHASQYLNSLGIPGIKYLDQGSRGSAPTIRKVTILDPETNTFTKQQYEVNPGWHEPNKKYHFSTPEEAQAHADSYGTRNYISFDPATVKILEENGNPLDILKGAK
jgi:hypothetical protein